MGIRIDEGRVYPSLAPTFKLLSEAVFRTNSSKVLNSSKVDNEVFEQEEKIDTSTNKLHFDAVRPILLPR